MGYQKEGEGGGAPSNMAMQRAALEEMRAQHLLLTGPGVVQFLLHE